MAFKGYFDLGPTSLNAMFSMIVHERDLRSNEAMKVMVPRTNTQFVERNFAVRGPLYWTGLVIRQFQKND